MRHDLIFARSNRQSFAEKTLLLLYRAPNERLIYRLMLVQEGSREGLPTQHTYDNHDSAAEQTVALNSSLGLSQRDSQAISAVFAQYDPYYEEEYFDDYSHNND